MIVKLDLAERRTLVNGVDVSAAITRDGVKLNVSGIHCHVTISLIPLKDLDTLAAGIQTAIQELEQTRQVEFDVTGIEPFKASVEFDWAVSRFTDRAEIQAFLDRHPGHYYELCS